MKVVVTDTSSPQEVVVRVLDEWDYIVEYIKKMKGVDNGQYPEAYDV